MSQPTSRHLLARMAIAFTFAAAGLLPSGQSRADIMDVDLSGVPVQYRSAFIEAERFWETRLIGFSGLLPRYVSSQLTKIQISATVTMVDGPGNVLGFAGPSTTFDYQGRNQTISISQTAAMTFDQDDAPGLLAAGLLDDVVRHEMAHALGFGSLWTANLLNTAPLGNYVGAYGLRQYRIDDHSPFAPWVPVEQQGGGGTAGAHWDSNDPFFFDPVTFSGELMIGFITDSPYVSEVTWASFADLWFKVRGINDQVIGTIPIPNGPKRIPSGGTTNNLSSVPEPASFGLLGVTLLAFGLRRNRKPGR